jgi:PleD family two-component response regulator
MIDVDWFKAFNDRYGHLAGDDCLRKVGGVLASTLQRPGDLAARYGGEEFVALLPNTDEIGAASVAERIRQAVLELAIKHDASACGVATIMPELPGSTRSVATAKRTYCFRRRTERCIAPSALARNTIVRASRVGELTRANWAAA